MGIVAASLLPVAAAIGLGKDGGAAQAQTTGPQAPADAARRAQAAAIRARIQNDPVAPTVAPNGADVTIVVFSDYQCPYCRKVHAALEGLLREDRKVKILYRDWPIFGAGSVEAARLAIASKYQGKHAAFNNAIMQTQGRINSQNIREAADKANIDWQRLQSDLKQYGTDIDGAIGRTRGYASMMGLTGTPALLVGTYLVPGAIDLPALHKVVALARKRQSEGPAS